MSDVIALVGEVSQRRRHRDLRCSLGEMGQDRASSSSRPHPKG